MAVFAQVRFLVVISMLGFSYVLNISLLIFHLPTYIDGVDYNTTSPSTSQMTVSSSLAYDMLVMGAYL